MLRTIFLLTLSAIFAFAIDINSATKEELMTIKGIGKKKAEAIINYRKTHKIKRVEELENIKGIGKNLINNLRNDIKKGRKNIKEKVSKKRKEIKGKIRDRIKGRVDKRMQKINSSQNGKTENKK